MYTVAFVYLIQEESGWKKSFSVLLKVEIAQLLMTPDQGTQKLEEDSLYIIPTSIIMKRDVLTHGSIPDWCYSKIVFREILNYQQFKSWQI